MQATITALFKVLGSNPNFATWFFMICYISIEAASGVVRHFLKAKAMSNYNLLPEFVTFRIGFMQYCMEPAIIGSFGNMRLLYTNGTKSVLIKSQIKDFDELEQAAKDFVCKNKAQLRGQYFYIPNSLWGEEMVFEHI